MSATQSPQEELVTLEEQEFDWRPGKPIGFYASFIGFGLVSLLLVQVSLTTVLISLNLEVPLWGLNTVLAALYGWGFAGLAVCLLLYLWLKSKPIAIGVTLLFVLLWAVGLVRYAHVPATGISRILIVILALGIPVVPALWFLRPFEPGEFEESKGSVGGAMGLLGWLGVWAILFFGLKEHTAGIALLLSLLTGGVVFLLGLYITCGFILPTDEKGHRRKAFDFLRDFTLGWNFPAYVVVDEPREEDKLQERVPGNVFSYIALGPGFVVTDANHAVAISDGIKFKGVQGPGVVFTGFADRVVRIVDLRPQLRAFHVEAMTKDGIRIRVLIFTPFKIDTRGRQPSLGEPLPYNKSAAFRAVLAEKMEHIGKGQVPENTKQRAWDELPRQITERILQDIISKYNFDDLYGPYQPGGEPPRKVIAQAFRERLAAELKPLGIQLVGGGISDLEPVDAKAYEERVRSWQAEWARKIALTQAEGRAEWLRRVERARAEAQAELILSLGRQLEELSAARAEIRPEDALNLLMSVLDGLTRRESVGPLLPGETLQALMNIRRIISE